MTTIQLIEDRLSLINKDTPLFIEKTKKQNSKLRINFIINISIFFLCFGIIGSLLSTAGLPYFQKRWMNSGLFFLCAGSFVLQLYAYLKYNLLEKHRSRLKELLAEADINASQIGDTNNDDLKSLLKSNLMKWINGIFIILGLTAGFSYFVKPPFWMYFDTIVFLIWSLYGLLILSKTSKLKKSMIDFEQIIQNSNK